MGSLVVVNKSDTTFIMVECTAYSDRFTDLTTLGASKSYPFSDDPTRADQDLSG